MASKCEMKTLIRNPNLLIEIMIYCKITWNKESNLHTIFVAEMYYVFYFVFEDKELYGMIIQKAHQEGQGICCMVLF